MAKPALVPADDDSLIIQQRLAQRETELAVINSIQAGLASKLEIQAIYELVGDKLRAIFQAQSVAISIYQPADGLFHLPYVIEGGQRLYPQPTVPGPVFRELMETHHPLLFNHRAEFVDLEATTIPGTSAPYSGAYVPLIKDERLIGIIALEDMEREAAFSESDMNLLQTIAGSMSVALENARLFDETQRLLKETEQHAAELVIINSVQEGLASKLDMQAIYDLVGDKLQDIFDAQVVLIASLNPEEGRESFDYNFELGERYHPRPRPYDGIRKQLVETRQPYVNNHITLEFLEQSGGGVVEGTRLPKSVILAPLVADNQVRGYVSIQNIDRFEAFTDSDVRLLQTLANSMSVALESARLFNETQRGAAELATINTVSTALAGELDLRTLITLIGDQIRTVFEADIAYVALLDEATNLISFPYQYGDILDPMQFGQGLTSKIIESGQPLLINQELDRQRASLGATVIGKHARSYLGVPIVVSGKAIGVVSVQNTHQENAFDENDRRLLGTLAANVGIALQNARLFDEITRRKEYFEALFRNNPVAVVTIENEARVTSWNPAAERLFGYTEEEATGRNVDDLVAQREDLHEEAVNYSNFGLDAMTASFQVIAKRTRKDGSLVDVELSAVPIVVQGKKLGIYALYHDITELQRARQEAVTANEAKSAFLANMSHEIRTPMNAVIGMSSLLMDTPLNEEQRDYAETIRNSGDTLLAVINDILDFSKIEAGRMDLEQRPFDLRECVESALDLVARRAIEKHLDLAYIIEDDVPAGVHGDVTRLRQILLNLLSNAIKFTEQGEVVLTVSRAQMPDLQAGGALSPELLTPDSIFFAVRDTGIGIPADRMDRLFESFSQADSSTTRRYGGTGLGLAISKRLAEMMGGWMWAHSEGMAKGSTFAFVIQAQAAETEPRRNTRAAAGIQPALQGKRVLIVDDNATNRRILRLQAEKWGMLPFQSESPGQALNWLRAGEKFDVALLDQQMPEMDGLQLTRELRKLKHGKSMPVILLTSLGRRELEAGDLDFSAYLAKPLKLSALFDALAGIFVGGSSAPQKTAQAALDASMAKRHPLRILVAEDNAINQKLVLRILEQMGYRADVASNGLEAIQSVERQTYDLVLMDVQMPEMDGLNATRFIRHLNEAAQPRIIAMTANAMQSDREMCIEAGMDDYISKPIRLNELVEALAYSKPAQARETKAEEAPPQDGKPGTKRARPAGTGKSGPRTRKAAAKRK